MLHNVLLYVYLSSDSIFFRSFVGYFVRSLLVLWIFNYFFLLHLKRFGIAYSFRIQSIEAFSEDKKKSFSRACTLKIVHHFCSDTTLTHWLRICLNRFLLYVHMFQKKISSFVSSYMDLLKKNNNKNIRFHLTSINLIKNLMNGKQSSFALSAESAPRVNRKED